MPQTIVDSPLEGAWEGFVVQAGSFCDSGDLTQDQDGNGTKDGVLSTDYDKVTKRVTYGLRAGTSMAAPQVTAAAALLLASGANPALVKDTLERRATDLGVMGFDEQYGHGLLNADPARAATPRAYVVALNAQSAVVTWAPVVDGTYTLKNVPPRDTLALRVLTDGDNDGHLGESGDLASSDAPVTLQPEARARQDFTLTPTSGDRSIHLQGP